MNITMLLALALVVVSAALSPHHGAHPVGPPKPINGTASSGADSGSGSSASSGSAASYSSSSSSDSSDSSGCGNSASCWVSYLGLDDYWNSTFTTASIGVGAMALFFGGIAVWTKRRNSNKEKDQKFDKLNDDSTGGTYVLILSYGLSLYLSLPWMLYRGLLSICVFESQCRSPSIVSHNATSIILISTLTITQ